MLTCSVVEPSSRSSEVNFSALVPSTAFTAAFGTQLPATRKDDVVSLGFQTAVVAPQRMSSNRGVVVGAAVEGTGVGDCVGDGVGSGEGIEVGGGVGTGVGVSVGLPSSITLRTSSQNPTELFSVLVLNFMPEPALKAIVERVLCDEVMKRLAILILSLLYALSSTTSICGSSATSVLTCSVVVPSSRSCSVNVCATVPSPALVAAFGTQLFETATDKSAADEAVSLGFQTAVVAPQSTPSHSGVSVGAAVEGTGVGDCVGDGVGSGEGIDVGSGVGTGVGVWVGLPMSMSKRTSSQNPTELLLILVLNFMPEFALKDIVVRALDDPVIKRLAMLILSLLYALSSTSSI